LKDLVSGSSKNLLDCIKKDPALKLEVRTEGSAFVYYRKGKALAIKGIDKFDVDKKYQNTPALKLAKTNPQSYFTQMKGCIDKWLIANKNRAEFDTQQKIAASNQSATGTYLILDMEYQFSQAGVPKNDRIPKTRFDLLGLECATWKIVFFELKRGLGAISGKSGIKDHITNFKKHLYGIHKKLFWENLSIDIKNIIHDKTELGLLENVKLPDNFNVHNPELIFIFQSVGKDDREEYENYFSTETKGLNKEYKTIFLRNGEYTLS
jgi:hypothetical protein